MLRYAATIFVSAFLLFQVQPMVARFILPWFGGSSLVWTTCMLFFQMALVFGYGYSHFITRRLSPGRQFALHTILLAVAILFLPVKPDDYWKPLSSELPTLRILALLLVSVGLPFFLLSTTGPLVQAWQSKTHPNRSPFRLFALSNFASLAALISYPFVFERYLTVDTQSWAWSLMFCLFAILAFLSAHQFLQGSRKGFEEDAADLAPPPGERSTKISRLTWCLWLLLPMLASVQLLATTNLMTQEIGSLPFLWIVPLSLYLISFIICFDHLRWYVRPVFYSIFFGAAIFSTFVLEAGIQAPITAQVIGYSLVCFGAAMCCHGELARIKPSPEHLTMFYLFVSIGGALGGVFVAVVAPRIFAGYYEFQLGIIVAIVCCLIAYAMQFRFKPFGPPIERLASDESAGDVVTNKTIPVRKPSSILFGFVVLTAVVAISFVCGSFVTTWSNDHSENVVVRTRNAYGTLTVREHDDYRSLTNGRTEHGFQFNDETALEPSSYYGPTSGLGAAIIWRRHEVSLDQQQGIDLGAIGLGVGTVCSWCEPDDTLRFFEINPGVRKIAQEEFTYLKNCETTVEIVLGDARLQLEREAKQNDPRRYDILIADAFSSDSIPIHLLTLESMEIYKSRLKPDGILAIHVSNRFLMLENIVRTLANELGMGSVIIDDDPDDEALYNSSKWVLVTNNRAFVQAVINDGRDADWPEERYSARWTDDFASIIPVIHWGEGSTWFRDLLVDKGWGGDEGEDEEDEDVEDEE